LDRHQVSHIIALILALRAHRRDDLARLVEHNVYALCRRRDTLTVDAHIVDGRVGFVSQDRLFSVYRDAPLFDEHLGISTRGNACR
jgi:hypothetical protein